MTSAHTHQQGGNTSYRRRSSPRLGFHARVTDTSPSTPITSLPSATWPLSVKGAITTNRARLAGSCTHQHSRTERRECAPEFPGRPPHQADARHRHACADPRQEPHYAAAGRRIPARRVLPGGDVRRRGHAHRPRDRIHRNRRRAGRPRDVLPDQRPHRPCRLPGGRPRRRLSLAVDRVRISTEGSQVRDQRRRAVNRRDAPGRRPPPWWPGSTPPG